MTKDNGLDLFKQCLETRDPILLIGAGFSCSATGKDGNNLPLGGQLCERLFYEVVEPSRTILDPEDYLDAEYYKNKKKLKELCDVIRKYEREGLVDSRNKSFEKIFSSCAYEDADFYQYLTDYDWSFIFSLNIDNLVERIYEDQGKPLTCWSLSPRHYAVIPSETVLVKLHGEIGKVETYVFDDKEYENFTISNCWMLQKFADLYVDHDVVFVGTQFQEKDIQRALSDVFSHGCDNTNFNYFFVSPGEFGRDLQQQINSRRNFYHIKMGSKEFLNFIHEKVRQPTEAVQKLTSQGIVYWNAALRQASKETWSLYHGNQPDPADFRYSVDIPRKTEMEKSLDFISNNDFGIIEVKGSPYVGKSCLVQRLLTEGHNKEYKAFYFPFVDLKQLLSFKEYISGIRPDENEKIMVCFENSAPFYRKITDILEDSRSNVRSFIAIFTSNDLTKGPAGPIFGSIPSLEIAVSERINGVLAESIYDKLNEKKQLGKLLSYSERGPRMIKYIRSINDIIDVLYIAHRGKRFTDYFTEWLRTAQSDQQFCVFQALTLLTALGVGQIKISLLSLVAEAVGCIDFDYNKFKTQFGDFCYERGGRLCLRCSRLFCDTTLGLMNTNDRKKAVILLASRFASRLEEYEHSYYSDIFQHIIRASNLTKIIGLSIQDALDTLIELMSKCTHLSYYWIQLGILYRDLYDYSNAENAFENAKDAHGRDNYQIAHARAKNYMEWGVWAVDHTPTQASELFESGASEMRKLPLRWRYSDAICFSMHAYVDMSLKYYDKTGIVPDEDSWNSMIKCTERYANNTNSTDEYLKNLILAMKSFGYSHHLSTDAMVQLENWMYARPVVAITTISAPSVDELPSYD